MSTRKSKKPELRSFSVPFTATAHGETIVDALDAEDAKRRVNAGEGEGRIIEWEYDEIHDATENA